MGVVNFQKLLEEAPQTKTAMQALENEFAPRRRELLTMQNDLKAKDEKLQKEGAVMSEADRAKAEKTLRDQQREFSRKAGEFQDDASTRRNEEIGKVQRYLVQEIQSYANAQGFDLVLGDGVFFAKGRRSTSRPMCWPCSTPSRRPCRPRRRRRAPSPPATPNSYSVLGFRTRMCASARGLQPRRVGGTLRLGAARRARAQGLACRDAGAGDGEGA